MLFCTSILRLRKFVSEYICFPVREKKKNYKNFQRQSCLGICSSDIDLDFDLKKIDRAIRQQLKAIDRAVKVDLKKLIGFGIREEKRVLIPAKFY